MDKIIKHRSDNEKPEWKYLLEIVSMSETNKIYRICRKMMIALERIGAVEIKEIISKYTPISEYSDESQNSGSNWPKPKGIPFEAKVTINDVFEIADDYLTDDDISSMLRHWLTQENLSFLSDIIERKQANLGELIETLERYAKITNGNNLLTDNERTGLTVALIQRLLSDNLNYVNIAKNHISIEFFSQITNNIIGSQNGYGKLGGKSAGLILANQIIQSRSKRNALLENIKMPRSWFVTSDTMYEFMHFNAIEEFIFTKYRNPEEIEYEFLFLEYLFKNSYFPDRIINRLEAILDDTYGKPLVVRSSSLLEDSFDAAFSGKYKSLFISNIGSKKDRLSLLLSAIAEVYASTFSPDPIEYRKERGLIDFREEMGILIQEVVGTQIGKYYLPSYAGVAFSQNEFRWSPRIEREDGIIRLVAGMGTRAVDRTMNDYPLLISPGKPGIKVNQSLQDKIRYSQQKVDVINLETNSFETIEFNKLISECNAEYPSLDKIVSFNRVSSLVEPVSALSDFMNEDLIITFNSLVDRTAFVPQIRDMLHCLKEAFGRPVDIEFAHDGKNLYLLQCRPQMSYESSANVKIPENILRTDIIFTADKYVNTCYIDNIDYIVYVNSNEYNKLLSSNEMYETGRIVGRLNRLLPRKKFILMGPGRWGSKGDIKLGVPVVYSDINNTAMLIEIAKESEGYVPELSFGTHFFQDLVEENIRYLPLYPSNELTILDESKILNSKNFLNEYLPEWSSYSKVIHLMRISNENPGTRLNIYMDSEIGKAVACIKKREVL